MSTPTSAPSTHQRLAYLDATRAFALVLGVVFHASLSFLPYFIGWAVQDVSTSATVGVFGIISHSFRMELFFLLAGFFSHLTLRRQGLRALLRSRVIRIAIPFLAGWFLLRPLVVSGWIMGGASMFGDYEVWPSLVGGFAHLKNLPQDLWVGTHLWFLYYLLLISATTLVGRELVTRSARVATALRTATDRVIAALAPSVWTPLLAALPILATLHFMAAWGVDTPDKSLVPHLPVFLLYGGFFALGWLIERQPETLRLFSRLSWGRLAALVTAIAVVVMIAPIQMDLGHPHSAIARWGFHAAYAVMMWLLVVLSIGVFRVCLSRESTIVRYLADSSYWMYLLHLPIAIWLQVAIAEVALPWSVKWAIVSGATITICVLTYDLFVRATWVGHLLNGRRRDRLIFRRTHA